MSPDEISKEVKEHMRKRRDDLIDFYNQWHESDIAYDQFEACVERVIIDMRVEGLVEPPADDGV